MKQTIRERARQGAAVVLSSHLLHLVEEICTRVLIMQRGRKVVLGTIEEILTERPDLRGRSLEAIFLTLTGTCSGRRSTSSAGPWPTRRGVASRVCAGRRICSAS